MNGKESNENLQKQILELENVAKELKEEKAKYRAIVEAFDGHIYICSQDYKIEFMNQNFIERTGHDPTGDLCYKALHDLDSICPWCVNDRIFEGETVRWEVQSPKDDRWFYVVNVPIHHSDGSISKQSMITDVTDRKKTERLLSEAYQILSGSPVAAFLWQNTEGWPVEYVTENVERIMGYRAEEFMTGTIRYSDVVHPEDLERVTSEVVRFSSDDCCKEFVHLPYRILKKGGETIWVEDKTVIRRDELGKITHYQGIIEDITERKNTEEALEASELFLKDVLDSVRDGICILDQDLTIIRVNRVMEEWYGDHASLEGKKCFRCYHNKDKPCDPCPSLRAINSGKTEFNTVPGPAGSPVEFLELFSFPILDRKSGTILGVVEFVRDVTEKRKLEHQLTQAQKMEAVGTMAGGIAHDFNNLLMGIQGRTSLMLLDNDKNHPHYEHLKGIEDYVMSAADLTKQLLGFARGGKYEVTPMDMNAVLDEVADMFRRTRKEIVLDKRFDPHLSTTEADRNQIETVLLNLLINAWHAMPGGGTLYLRTSNMALDEKSALLQDMEPGKYIKISITDSGVGMDERTRQRVFDPFFTTKSMGRGTGLGLASAYGIIKNHGGTINVDSQMGEGTTFNIYLPASDRRAKEWEERADALKTGTEKILFIDDEKIVVDVGVPMLASMGYTVHAVGSGNEAIDYFEKHYTEIDLVILDMIMPGMSGSDTFDGIRKIDPHVKVLLSSGYSINGQAQEILDRGCDGFVQKPFDLTSLSHKVRELLDQ